jgi:hypothetical protein
MKLDIVDAGKRNVEVVRQAVAKYMQIESVDETDPGAKGGISYRGWLQVPAMEAYDDLAAVFRQHEMTLFLRESNGKHLIQGVPGTIDPEPSNPMVNAVMFILTVISVVISGALIANVNFYGSESSFTPPQGLAGWLSLLAGGVPFAFAMLAILLAHEFGHYLAGRYHKTAVTLPYFIPFPGTILGTMGAFIRMKEPPKNKRVLLDIGVAGPLAGFAVALPILLIGLSMSQLTTLPASQAVAQGITLEGNSILYLAAKYVTTGHLLPMPVSFGDQTSLAYWVRYFFVARPIPFGGLDVLVHPLAWAGWAGMLVTALNLIPAGQLDGGHLLYVLFGRGVRRVWMIIVAVLLGMGFLWVGWWVWALLIFFLGRNNAQPLDEITELDGRRRALAILGLVIFFLTFTPIPLTTLTG